MMKFFRKILAALPDPAISFSAKSAILATSLASAGRIFAGASPSGGRGGGRIEILSDSQKVILKEIVTEKLEDPNLSVDEKDSLKSLLDKLNDTSSENPSGETSN